jgi:hypothetical protein
MSFGALTKYTGRRLAVMILQLFAMTVAVFVLIRLLPTDPAAQRVGIIASPEALQQARASLGLDQSVPAQLWEFVKGLAQFDLGNTGEVRETKGPHPRRGTAKGMEIAHEIGHVGTCFEPMEIGLAHFVEEPEDFLLQTRVTQRLATEEVEVDRSPNL